MGLLHVTLVLLSVSRGLHATQCPATCYCDTVSRYVHCQGDRGTTAQLPSEVARDTQRLELRDFHIGTLRWEITRDLFPSQLLELSIRNSHVTELINGSLSVLGHLDTLDLSHNNIFSLQPGIFDTLSSLRHLDLGHNELKDMRGDFLMLKLLETLDLSNNKLETLTVKTFNGLQSIQWLDISSNSITKIEPGTFLPMPNLERLVLGNNPLISLQRLEFLGARLRYMDVSEMKLQRAPESLGPSVRELRATRNELRTLQRGDLDSYPSLTLLDLSHNHLAVVEDDALGRLEYLAQIYLVDNKLTKVPKSLPRVLRTLSLDYNEITAVHATELQGLPHLSRLSLAFNKLTTLSADLMAYLPGLRHLDVSHNCLSTIIFTNSDLEDLNLSDNPDIVLKSDTFATLQHLRVLHLGNISRKFDNTVKEIITPLPQLVTLDLQGSANLTAEALKFQVWFELHEMNLKNTSLSILPDALWSSTGKLKVIHLSYNPWNCSADFQNKISARDSRFKIIDEGEMRCQFPASVRGSTVLLSNISTMPPSLAPTRLQIVSPGLRNATSKPQSTSPLRYEPSTVQIEVKKRKKSKPELQAINLTRNTTNSNNTTEKPLNVTVASKPMLNLTQYEVTTEKLQNVTTKSLNLSKSEITVKLLTKTEITAKSSNLNKTEITAKLLTKTENTAKSSNLSNIENTAKSLNLTKKAKLLTKTEITTKSSNLNKTENTAKSLNLTITAKPLTKTEKTIILTTTTPILTLDTTSTNPEVNYEEELAVVIDEEELYEEPGNFSELRASQMRILSQHNVPVGFLSIIGVCFLGASLMVAYHCRQARKWQRLRPHDDLVYMDTLTSERW